SDIFAMPSVYRNPLSSESMFDISVDNFTARNAHRPAILGPMASGIPSLSLNDGTTIPQLGLGVYKVPEKSVADVVTTAIDAGYRHIDTATLYANEKGVGE